MARMRQRDFERLLAFRVALRGFNRWSEQQAQSVGLTHSQHQLLLAVRGHPDPAGPTVGQVAGYLMVRHHSAVELVDRVQRRGLVRRERSARDQRVVRVRLTPAGARIIDALTGPHLDELRRLAPVLDELVDDDVGSIRVRGRSEPRQAAPVG